MKSSSRFYRINKLGRDYSHWQILYFVCPVKYHVYPISPRARAKMAGFLNYGVSGRKVAVLAVKHLNPIDGP